MAHATKETHERHWRNGATLKHSDQRLTARGERARLATWVALGKVLPTLAHLASVGCEHLTSRQAVISMEHRLQRNTTFVSLCFVDSAPAQKAVAENTEDSQTSDHSATTLDITYSIR